MQDIEKYTKQGPEQMNVLEALSINETDQLTSNESRIVEINNYHTVVYSIYVFSVLLTSVLLFVVLGECAIIVSVDGMSLEQYKEKSPLILYMMIANLYWTFCYASVSYLISMSICLHCFQTSGKINERVINIAHTNVCVVGIMTFCAAIGYVSFMFLPVN